MTNRFSFAASRLSVDLIEDGAFCHFTDPATGELLYLPGPRLEDGSLDPKLRVGAYVRSAFSQVYEKHLDEATRKGISGNKRAKTDEQKQLLIFKQIKEDMPGSVAVLVRAFLNTSAEEPGEWVPSYEEKFAIASDPHQKPYMDQITKFAEDSTNYPADAGNVDAA